MDDVRRDEVIQWYEQLEAELRNILSQLPPVPPNLDRYSFRLASIAVEACSIIDSLFRQSSVDPSVVDGKSVSRDDLTIVDFAILHSRDLRLPDLKSILLIARPQYVTPFRNWAAITSKQSYAPLDWWQDYNLLKHDRIENWEKGNLKLAIECVCALHQLITRLPGVAPGILRYSWIPESRWNPELISEFLRTGKGLGGDDLSAETRLFVTPLGPRPLPDDVNDFQPALYSCSRRICAFFGRWG